MHRRVWLAVLVALLACGGWTPAVAADLPPGQAEGQEAAPVLVPEGQLLGDEQLDSVSGQGFLGAVIGAAAGWVTGFASYAIDYYWDAWVDDSPRRWSWREAWKETLEGALTGALAGALTGP